MVAGGSARAPAKPGATRSFPLVMLRTIRLDAPGSRGTFCWPVSGQVFVSVADYICGKCHHGLSPGLNNKLRLKKQLLLTPVIITDLEHTVRRCHGSRLADVGTSSTLDSLFGGSEDMPPEQRWTPWSPASHSAMFLHIAILHNKYQITNRAMDALLWYCEPKHHTRAFCTSCCAVMSLPVYEKHYPGPVRVLWCPVAA